MMRIAITIIAVIIFFSDPVVYGQGWKWSAGCTGGSEGTAVASDIWGNSYGAGFSNPANGTLTFGPVTLSNLGSSAAAVVKYDTKGNLVWAKSTHNGFARPLGIATDVHGSLYELGYYTSATLDFGSVTLTRPSPDSELFLVKYSPSGNISWAINVCKGYFSGSIASNGDAIFITGAFRQSTNTIGSFTLNNADPSGTSYDLFVAKLDTSGNVVWATSAGGSGSEFTDAIAVTQSGNTYISGRYNSPLLALGPNTLLTSANSLFVAKLDGGGNILWGKLVGGNSDFVTNVATDPLENVFITGSFFKTTLTFGSTSFTSDIYARVFLAKYDALGNVNWAKQVPGNSSIFAYGITADLCGDVWISGSIPRDTGLVNIEGNIVNLPTGSRDPLFIAQWDAVGTYLTSAALPTAGDDGSALSTDGVGNLYLGGDYLGGPYTVGGVTLNDPKHNFEDIFVAKYATPNIPDTAYVHKLLCISDTTGVTLHATPGFTNYVWDNGSTAPDRFVDSPGTYSVLCVGECNYGVVNKIFKVDYGKLDTSYFHTDTSICLHAQMALVAPTGFGPYLWSDGKTSQADTISSPGSYLVICSGTCTTPSLFDTFFVVYNYIDMSFSLGDDTNVCAPYLIKASISDVSYLWEDGTTRNTDLALQQGIYYVTVMRQGCFSSDSVNVFFPDLTQHLRDTVLCREKPVAVDLKANAPNGSNVLWSTGSIEHEIVVNAAGKYWVTVTNSGCSGSDTMVIAQKFCYCTAFLPDAFTPNGDGHNDYFSPIVDKACDLYDYSFCIYNRWGQLIFTTHDPSAKWDGRFHNVMQDMGTYMYYLEYRVGNTLYRHSYKGDVTLIR